MEAESPASLLCGRKYPVIMHLDYGGWLVPPRRNTRPAPSIHARGIIFLSVFLSCTSTARSWTAAMLAADGADRAVLLRLLADAGADLNVKASACSLGVCSWHPDDLSRRVWDE